MSNLELWKAIWEVRYPATASLFDKRGAIATRWQGHLDLTEWQIAPNRVKIFNKSNTTVLRVGHLALGVVAEKPARYNEFCELASGFSTYILEMLNIGKIDRIGLRLIQIVERKSFKALVSKMRKRLYNLQDEEWKVLGGYPEDIGLPFTLKLAENMANFSLGPMRREQLEGFFESKEIKEQLPATVLFLDFDLYRASPKITLKAREKDLKEFLKSGGEQILDMSANFVEQCGGFE